MMNSKNGNKKNNKNVVPLAKNVKKKQCASVYKFDIERILKERQKEKEDAEKNAEYYKELENLGKLIKADEEKEAKKAEEEKINLINKMKAAPVKLGVTVFDPSKYNLLFMTNSNSNTISSYSNQFLQLSIEENELNAHYIYNYLMNSDLPIVFKDIQNIFYNWGADCSTLVTRPILGEIKERKIGYNNFKLIFEYILYSILKYNTLSKNDLLTLAKFTVTISYDSHCGQMINVLQNLFTVCIEKALRAEDIYSIIAFAEELFAIYTKDEIMMIVINLLLPLEGPATRKMYCYFTFKLFKSFTGTTNNNFNAFPIDINDWFVQDVVPKEYFKKHPDHLVRVIRLLEHVVFILNLYENAEKLRTMSNYLNSFVSKFDYSLTNILGTWNSTLLRLFVYDNINKY